MTVSRKKELTRLLIQKRASQETFRGGTFNYAPPQYEVVPGKPKFIVRALYGPMNGLVCSFVVTYRYDERLLQTRHDSQKQPVAQANDGLGHWGPRKFLSEVFSAVGSAHGDCTIFMVHSGVTMAVDHEEFVRWARQADKEPVVALLEPRKLLLSGSSDE